MISFILTRYGGYFIMKWNIICDSSCDLLDFESNTEGATYKSVPFVISIEGKDFIDDASLDTGDLIRAVKESKTSSLTACPSPQGWMELLEKDACNILVTISKNLSGSYTSADIALKMFAEENKNLQAFIIDSRATGPSAVLAVRKITGLIKEGNPPEVVERETKAYLEGMNTCFALSSFDNLVRNGRMSRLAGVLAKSLEFWGVGIEKEGKIALKTKTRGKKKALAALLETMKENGLCGKDIVISHCHNNVMAEKLKEEIVKTFDGINVTIMPTRGLNSYYAEDGGVIVSY